MLGIGWGELIVILAVIVIFADPKDIPGLARNFAEIIKKFRSISSEFTSVVTKEVEQPKRFIKDLNGNIQPTYELDDLMPKKPVTENKEPGNEQR